ncbi:DUF4010 domain-containing protein [Rhizobium sp. CNPSo 3968]|uniref:MgtC/SapB family protein n=1 Tax=Rhizobium sp. CNPSo 3968 TaxID=3021408 RepID=UPI000DDD069F|nr:DUF4010 domain-containing protein [Rhizobium sp. CNPSo 3968]MDK4718855.1 DUF4010 domain-containing protein [Rhizobium sp. CNPSo 3968]
MITNMATIEAFQRLGLALAIGILVGIERGWQDRDVAPGKRTAGIRTYGLTGFLGGFCGFLYPSVGLLLPLAIFLVFSITMIIFSYMEAEKAGDYSATGMIAAVTVFALGFGAVIADMTTTAAAAVAITALLAAREPLHGFLRRLTWLELRAALILLCMTVVILPLLPNRALDSWNAINPFELWIMTILVAFTSFAGYVLIKLMSPRAGILATGIAGGIVSSTALTLSFARQSSHTPQLSTILSSGAMAAGAVSLMRTLLLCSAIAPETAETLVAVLLPSSAALAIGSIAGLRRTSRGTANFMPTNPLEIWAILRFVAILLFISLMSRAALAVLGTNSLFTIAFVSGLGDLDAITLTLAKLTSIEIKPNTAVYGIALAATGNLLTKSALATTVGTKLYSSRLLLATILAIAAGTLGLLVPYWSDVVTLLPANQ